MFDWTRTYTTYFKQSSRLWLLFIYIFRKQLLLSRWKLIKLFFSLWKSNIPKVLVTFRYIFFCLTKAACFVRGFNSELPAAGSTRQFIMNKWNENTTRVIRGQGTRELSVGRKRKESASTLKLIEVNYFQHFCLAGEVVIDTSSSVLNTRDNAFCSVLNIQSIELFFQKQT